jgi:hypothetical protein
VIRGEAKVSDLNSARRIDCGFQIAMDDVSLVQVPETVEQLVCQGLENRHGDWCSKRLGVMVNDLPDELRISRFDLLGQECLTRRLCSAYSKTI